MQNVMQALYLTRNARGLPASARRYSEEGARRVQTLNMVNAKLADKYQTGADSETPPDDPKNEKDPPPAEPDGAEAKEA